MISRLTLAEMRLAAAQYQLNIAQLHQELASGHPRSPHDHLQREVEDQQVRAADYALLIDLAEQHNDAEAMAAEGADPLAVRPGGTHDTCRPEDCPWAGQ